MRLCHKACEYISDKSKIFVDGTSTTFFLGEFFDSKNDIIVTTTNLKLGVICGEKNIPCYIPGGKITDTNMLSGFITDDTLSKMSFDVCVFSPGAMDAAGGLGVSEYFANATRIAVAKPEKSIYLCDVSKLDKRIFIEALNLENVDVFISDVSVSDELRKKYPETEFVKI